MSRGATIALVGVLTAIGAVVRLAITRGLSVDELTAVAQARLPLGTLIDRLGNSGGHPPLHPVLQWCAVRLIGDSDFAVRLPSLVAGVALIPVVALLAAEVFDRRTAVVAALFTTVAPILVWYSQEARGYALAALFGTVTILCTARVNRRGRSVDWALYTVAAALTVWSDWFGLFIVIASELALAVELRHRRRTGAPRRPFLIGWAVSTLALACQFVPLGVLAASQAHRGLSGFSDATSVGASGVSFYTTVSNVSWALFGFHPAAVTRVLSAVWPLVMLATLLMVGRGLSRRASLLTAFAAIPVLGVLVLGLFAPGTFDVRYFVVAVPPVLVLWARMATTWPGGTTGRAITAGAVCLVLCVALLDQQLDSRNPRRYDYGQALAQVKAHAPRGTVVLFEPRALRVVLDRYAPGLRARPLNGHLPTRRQADDVEVVTSFTDQPRYRALRDREIGALRATRHLRARRHYAGVDVWWFK
jgi:mannosyltransferase